MKKNLEDYGLDLHCTMILEDYRAHADDFAIMKEIVLGQLVNLLRDGEPVRIPAGALVNL